MKVELSLDEISVINCALNQRIEYFQDLLDNYEGFGIGIKQIYTDELENAQKLFKKFQEV